MRFEVFVILRRKSKKRLLTGRTMVGLMGLKAAAEAKSFIKCKDLSEFFDFSPKKPRCVLTFYDISK